MDQLDISHCIPYKACLRYTFHSQHILSSARHIYLTNSEEVYLGDIHYMVDILFYSSHLHSSLVLGHISLSICYYISYY